MKIRPSHKSFLSLESIAMTDIVMNLFIFFFISFSLLYTFNPKKESRIEVKLPDASVREAASKENTPLVVSVTSGNEIYIEKRLIPPSALKKEFLSRQTQAKNAGIVVRSDKAASVDTLVKVLDVAKQTGAQKLGVAVESAGA